MLANDGELLPLTPGGQTVAVIGEFACSPRYQGAGSSQVVPTKLDNALDAILDLEGADRVTFAPGFTFDGTPDDDMVTEAVDAARRADVAVLFLGLPSATESEGFDRTDIELPADQIALLEAVHGANPNTVVVLANGGVVSIELGRIMPPQSSRAGYSARRAARRLPIFCSASRIRPAA